MSRAWRWLSALFLLVTLTLVVGSSLGAGSDLIPLSKKVNGHREPSAEDVRRAPAGWESVRTRYLEIQYPPGEAGVGRRFVEIGDELLEDASETLDLRPAQRYVVRLAGDWEGFARAQPSRPPSWAAGIAYSRYGLMVLVTRPDVPWRFSNSIEKTFMHESAHLLLGDFFRDRPIPRWLNEGLARIVAREVQLDEWAMLSRAVLVRGLIPFSELESRFPVGKDRAGLAYAQSRDFLRYLTKRFGPDILPSLVREIQKGDSLNESLWTVSQHGLTALEQDWQAELRQSYGWISAIFGGLSLWGLVAVLLVIGYMRRKVQSRRRRARWALEEAELYGEEDEPWAASAPELPDLTAR